MQACIGQQEITRSPLCDGLLVMGGTAILIECKASIFSLAARAGYSEREYFDRLEEIVVKGARRLDSTLKLLLTGRFAPLGFELARVREVFPIIVSLQEIFLNFPLRRWIADRLSANGYLVGKAATNVALYPLDVFD